MSVISTFVIFDIETTGLPRYEQNRTKITELTFLAVASQDIERTTIGCVPLVNKLSYLFNPQKNIQPEVSDLTGLTNVMLQSQPIFRSRIESLTSFLEELPKPVCLIAHNGNSFDFKILRSEFMDAGVNLPNDLLCLDSLWGFKKILKDTNLCHKTLLPVNTTAISSMSDDDILTDDEDWPDFNTTGEEWDEVDKLVTQFTRLSPDNGNQNCSYSLGDIKSTKRHMNVDKTEVIKSVFEKKPKTENISCTLQALYKRLLDKEAVNAHRSEADCVMLLECIVALKDYFLPYANEKCKLISAVEPFKRYERKK